MTRSRNFWWAVASLAIMIVGAVGPWAKVLGFITINGTDDGRDGWVVLGAAVVATAVLVLSLRLRRRWLTAIPVLAGCVGAATAAYDISDIDSVAAATLGAGTISAGWGIYLALVGSVSLTLASIALLLGTRHPAPIPRAESHPEPVHGAKGA